MMVWCEICMHTWLIVTVICDPDCDCGRGRGRGGE